MPHNQDSPTPSLDHSGSIERNVEAMVSRSSSEVSKPMEDFAGNVADYLVGYAGPDLSDGEERHRKDSNPYEACFRRGSGVEGCFFEEEVLPQ